MTAIKNILRGMGRCWISRFGSPIRDEQTGEFLGRALIVVWRGRIHLIGLTTSVPLRPVFTGQDRVRYWRQSIGFERVPEPDFPRKLPE